jgi:hypothetical protein
MLIGGIEGKNAIADILRRRCLEFIATHEAEQDADDEAADPVGRCAN